ncbi:LOW QUALITY PROTEIN: all-trans-retinol 13,14-reductase-like [Macrobrachium nipponense]|uniref:LOW QUALITY PROTEIN: all-trans-retinol 13,14-reductase-like n=1 Tax=Macrobrachium nipponense TaxID=159736 RepID=UPI0030C8CB48
MAIGVLPLLIAAAAAFMVVKLLMFIFAKPPSANPFEKRCTAEIRPKVIDQKQRDQVLKQGFSKDKIPDGLDAIVIGSGIGGLSTAALLSKAGKKVLVLEQHDQAGGCCHTFIDKGYEFDVGIHYIGEMHYQSVTKTFVDHITNRQLDWAPLEDDFDEVVFAEKDKELRRYPVYSGKEKWAASLKKHFPDEEDNIDKFFGIMDDVRRNSRTAMLVKFIPLWCVKIFETTGLINLFTNFYKWNALTVKDVLSDVIGNQELRDILCYNFGDFGTPPSKAGLPMQTLLHSHFAAGSSYPVGGASEIAFHIIPVIEESGGKVLVRAEVEHILLDSEGKVCGVQVKKGSSSMDVNAPLVISDAGVYNTYKKLLPLEVASSSNLWSVFKSCESGPGCMSVFVGLDCPAEDLDIYHRKNVWAFSDNDIDKLALDYLSMTREEAENVDVPLIFISFPSTKDPEWNKKYPGKTTMALVTFIPYEWFSDWENERVMKRGDEYESIKKVFGYKAIDQACRLFPSIKDHIDYVSIGTPVTNKHYIAAPKGEIYGLDHTSARFSLWNNALLRPKTDIPGLFLTGQDICSCGFSGALWGGFLCAGSVLQRNIMNDLTVLHRRVKLDAGLQKKC